MANSERYHDFYRDLDLIEDFDRPGCRITPDDGLRIVLCPVCGSEGRLLTNDGGPYDEDHGECPECEGCGLSLVEVEPIELFEMDLAFPVVDRFPETAP